MLFKLAANNVKKSARDYLIYFLTLSFGICLFYMFNSLEAQQAMLKISSSTVEILKALSNVMGYVSIFVTAVLAFLMLYANSFLIKRRKKELGIYMTLGMERTHISTILVLETLLIGILSLGVGLIIGVFLSQGFSVLTAKLFLADLTGFTFVFSIKAMIKTIIFFGIVFILVILFNIRLVGKIKLIDMLFGDRKNEDLKLKNLTLSVVLFIISIICLGTAYVLIIKNGMIEINLQFLMSIILGIIGTFLFFMSLSGFFLKVLQSNKKLYLKNLNMFVLRQLNSKINTTFVSMTMICLMLLISIGTLSTGLSVEMALSKDLDSNLPYDATYYHYPDEGDDNPQKSMAEGIEGLDTVSKDYFAATLYYSGIKLKEVLEEHFYDLPKTNQELSYDTIVVTQSDFNKVLNSQNRELISMKDDEYLMCCSNEDFSMALNNLAKANGSFELKGKTLTYYSEKVVDITMENTAINYPGPITVVPDDSVQDLSIYHILLNINYFGDKTIAEQNMIKIVEKEQDSNDSSIAWGATREQIIAQSAGMKATVAYIAIYIGLIFMITSVVVLALQQLSQASDNVKRYALLKKIGAEKKMINHALFRQILIYFMMPLTLAIIHSIVGIKVAVDTVGMVSKIDIWLNTFIMALFILVVYGGYFFATYAGSKSIINSKK